MRLKNQSGITLVELLAAIVIVGFLTVLIWRIFFQTIDQNSYVVTEQTLQQEANVILTTLQSIHTKQTIERIHVVSSGEQLDVYVVDTTEPIDPDGILVQSFKRTGISYQLYETKPKLENNKYTGTEKFIQPSSDPLNNRITIPIHLVLTSEYKESRLNQFLLSTTLSKLTTN